MDSLVVPTEQKNRRILVVDDDPGILDTYVDVLQPRHSQTDELKAMLGMSVEPSPSRFEVSAAAQGEAAVTLVRDRLRQGRPYAMAFIDMRMPPGVDGLETAKSIRALDEHIFIVIVTAYTDRSIEEIQRELGHDVLLLRKPFTQDELLQSARTLIDIRHRDELRLRRLGEAQHYSELLERSFFMTPSAARGRGTVLEPRPSFVDTLGNIPRITLLGRDRDALTLIRRHFPQTANFSSWRSDAFRRREAPELIVLKMDAELFAQRRALVKWMGTQRDHSAFLLYGPRAAEMLECNRDTLHGLLLGRMPERPGEEVWASAIGNMTELRSAVRDISDPDYPILGKSLLFANAIERAKRIARVGEPLLIRARTNREARAVALYLHRASGQPGKLQVLFDPRWDRIRSKNELYRVLDQLLGRVRRAGRPGGLFVEGVDNLPEEFQAPLVNWARHVDLSPVMMAYAADAGLSETLRDACGPFVVEIPGYAERPDDLLLLTSYLVMQFSQRIGTCLSLSEAEARALAAGAPNDVDGIRHTVFSRLSSRDLTAHSLVTAATHRYRAWDERIGQFEAAIIRQVLHRCEGRLTPAARLLGMRPNTLHYKLRRYGIRQ